MYVGRIELLGGEAEVLQQILRGGTMRYKVHFPLFSPLPRVTAITFNGVLMCQGPPGIPTLLMYPKSEDVRGG